MTYKPQRSHRDKFAEKLTKKINQCREWMDNEVYRAPTEWKNGPFTIKWDPFLNRYPRYSLYSHGEFKGYFDTLIQAKDAAERKFKK